MIFRLAEKTFFLSACCSAILLTRVENVPEGGTAMRLRGSFFLYLSRFAVLKRNDRLSCESELALAPFCRVCGRRAFRRGKMKAGSLGKRQILRVAVSENRVFPAASGLGDKKGIPEWEY